MSSENLPRAVKIAQRIAAEEAEIVAALKKAGLLEHQFSEADLEGLLLTINLSIPDVAAKWEEGKPMMLLSVGSPGSQSILLYNEFVEHDSSADPLVFIIGEYAQNVQDNDPAHVPVPMASAVVGFFGECVRGLTSGSKMARYYLSEFFRLVFPDQKRVYLEIQLDETNLTDTLSIKGYFSAA